MPLIFCSQIELYFLHHSENNEELETSVVKKESIIYFLNITINMYLYKIK